MTANDQDTVAVKMTKGSLYNWPGGRWTSRGAIAEVSPDLAESMCDGECPVAERIENVDEGA